jgi:hypothetical protein
MMQIGTDVTLEVESRLSPACEKYSEQVRNLMLDLEGYAGTVKFLVRDRDAEGSVGGVGALPPDFCLSTSRVVPIDGMSALVSLVESEGVTPNMTRSGGVPGPGGVAF